MAHLHHIPFDFIAETDQTALQAQQAVVGPSGGQEEEGVLLPGAKLDADVR